MITVRDTILRLTKELVESGGYIASQSLVGPGALQNTFPREYSNDTPGILDLPIQDSSNNGICVGYALAGKRICHVIRFSPFGILNLWTTLNYAAISQQMWMVPVPILIRSINVMGQIGPVASGPLASIPLNYPGIKVSYPITSLEYETAWEDWLKGTDPYYLQEARASYNIKTDFLSQPQWSYYGKCTIFPVGTARLYVGEAVQILRERYRIECSIAPIWRLKPLHIPEASYTYLFRSRMGLVVEDGRVDCGVSQYIVSNIINSGGLDFPRIYTLGLEDRVSGFSKAKDNITPSVQTIVDFILEKLGKSN